MIRFASVRRWLMMSFCALDLFELIFFSRSVRRRFLLFAGLLFGFDWGDDNDEMRHCCPMMVITDSRRIHQRVVNSPLYVIGLAPEWHLIMLRWFGIDLFWTVWPYTINNNIFPIDIIFFYFYLQMYLLILPHWSI